MTQNRLIALQQQRNNLSARFTQQFEPHRDRVTRLVQAAGSGRLCLLGAGNCNDIDLSLLDNYSEIHLVDIDASAVQRAAKYAPAGVAEKIRIHTPVDLTGIVDVIAPWKVAPPTNQQFDEAIFLAENYRANLTTSFDVVVSLATLSQIVECVALSVDPTHPSFHALLMTVRDRHLHLLFSLLATQGTVILISDFVSSDTLPQLPHLSNDELARMMPEILNTGNFFTGTNPVALQQAFDRLAHAKALLGAVSIEGPWRWDMGRKAFAVCGIVFICD